MKFSLENVSPLPTEIELFLKELARNANVKRLIVYGSRACGDFEKYSDVDVAINFNELSAGEWVTIRQQAYYDVRTVLQISLVDFDKRPEVIKERILQNGVVIYEQ